MSAPVFNALLNLIKPLLIKRSIRRPIGPECRLALSLLYLSQGCSIQTLAWSFKLGKETCRQIILETCDALWKTLAPFYVAEPNLNDFNSISDDFWTMWNMPNCVGAIDDKHISIRCPPNANSQFYCYKNFHSIVLLAACDAKYTFTFVDVGAYGSQSDGGIFQESSFGKRLMAQRLPIPPPKQLPGMSEVVPHYFVGDAAFPLTPNLMRPFPGLILPKDREIYNKRLSRARRIIENSFGILVARWRILQTTLNMIPENVEQVVLACVTLHNYLRLNIQAQQSYCPKNYVDWEDTNNEIQLGSWRNEVEVNLQSIKPSRMKHRYGGNISLKIRENICKFVNENKI